MKSLFSGSAMVAAMLALSFSAVAGDTLVSQDNIMGRSYHQQLYVKHQCATCHGVDKPVSRAPDDSCLKCHSVDKLAQKTARQGDEVWQNPHNNLHYGKDVPCTECHAEHAVKQPMCKDCHTFKFSHFKA
ncbi:cytochrome c3 family protein [Shewanella sp. YIC-542]|uniref:cytochrome c3 family protein n=1 Tax=Shewanella mytili TaxID=3377111 RepID=UPI00398F237E